MTKNLLHVPPDISIPTSEFAWSFVRSGGPGGQNVNKVSTKAVLHWNVGSSPSLPESVRQRFLQRFRRRIDQQGVLVVSSQRYRQQRRNVEDCYAKLQAMLQSVATPPRPRRPTRPTRGSIERRLEQKRLASLRKKRRRPLEGNSE